MTHRGQKVLGSKRKQCVNWQSKGCELTIKIWIASRLSMSLDCEANSSCFEAKKSNCIHWYLAETALTGKEEGWNYANGENMNFCTYFPWHGSASKSNSTVHVRRHVTWVSQVNAFLVMTLSVSVDRHSVVLLSNFSFYRFDTLELNSSSAVELIEYDANCFYTIWWPNISPAIHHKL